MVALAHFCGEIGMSIEFACDACGKSFKVKEELAGRKAKCKCGHVLTVPRLAPEPEPEPTFFEETDDDLYGFADEPPAKSRASVAVPAPVPAYVTAANTITPARPVSPSGRTAKSPSTGDDSVDDDGGGLGSPRRLCYALMLIARIPLAWSVFFPDGFSFRDALVHTIETHPEVAGSIQQIMDSDDASEEDFFNALPDHRVDGAFLSHDTYMHWLYALVSSAGFTALLLAIFPRSTKNLGRMALIGLFTATIGIFLLLGFQWVADFTQGMWVRGRGILVLLFYIVKFIGFSYRAALDPNSNVILSAIGFTFGVGLCEELCKSAPVLCHYQWTNNKEWPWRTACLVGLMSGVGFGVSEAIHYSSDYYNGIQSGQIYVVRFVSCVALHALWSGGAAIFIFRYRAQLQQSESVWGGAITWVALISIPMVLHGLYDTLLKKEHDAWALAVAAASLAWFIWQIEWARKNFDEEENKVPARYSAAAA